jgi:phosphotransferase system HPr (HPr) family protein
MKTPKVEKEDGFTTIDAKVNCSFGIAMRTAKALVDEAKKYNGIGIFFYSKDTQVLYNARKILDLLGMGAEKGTGVKIKVEGEDEQSRQIALRYFSALSSKDSFDLDFDQYSNVQ